MRILDEQNQEITSDDVDFNLGHLEEDYILIQFHPQENEIPEISHYEIDKVLFTDGSEYIPTGPDDEHIENEGFVPFGEYLDKEIKQTIGHVVIDQEYVPMKEEWFENERILRYVLYTEEELAEIAARKAAIESQMRQEQEARNQYQNMLTTVDDLVVMMADIIGNY